VNHDDVGCGDGGDAGELMKNGDLATTVKVVPNGVEHVSKSFADNDNVRTELK
jgi:hypothetical protein